MADYVPCRRGERPFAPTILYTMEQITPYILKTQEFQIVSILFSRCDRLYSKAFSSPNSQISTQKPSKGVTTVETYKAKLFLKFAYSLREFNVDSLFCGPGLVGEILSVSESSLPHTPRGGNYAIDRHASSNQSYL